MLKAIISYFSFAICIFVATKSIEYFKIYSQSTKITIQNDSISENDSLTKTFSKFCGHRITSNGRLLKCYCKKNSIFKFDCQTKIEIFNDEPLIAVFHGLFKDKLEDLRSSAKTADFKKVRLGNEYGLSRLSKFVSSENGVLEANSFATKFVYDRLWTDLHIIPKCNKMTTTPKATVVKYQKGNYFGIHYDANNYTYEHTLGPWLGGRLFRGLVESLETCRHRYNNFNVFACLYKLYVGQLQKTEYWDSLTYGPRLITGMVQLSDVVGGETIFPVSNIAVHTNRGDMLIWANVDDHWNRYDSSMHGGCPVLSDEKLIVVVFIPGQCNTLSAINYHLRN